MSMALCKARTPMNSLEVHTDLSAPIRWAHLYSSSACVSKESPHEETERTRFVTGRAVAARKSVAGCTSRCPRYILCLGVIHTRM